MSNKKHCDNCGGFETVEGACGKCDSRFGTIIPGRNRPPGNKTLPRPKTVKRLTRDEYRIWREACERIARGFKGIAPKIGDTYYVMVNNKIVLTTGEYPFDMSLIMSFDTADEQVKFLQRKMKNG